MMGNVKVIADTLSENFFVMEMNNNFQVEHPITQIIVSQDLVKWFWSFDPGINIKEEKIFQGFTTKTHFLLHYNKIMQMKLPAELYPNFSSVEYLILNYQNTQNFNPVVVPFSMYLLIDEELLFSKLGLKCAMGMLPDNVMVRYALYGMLVQVQELEFSEMLKVYVFRGSKNVSKDQVLEQLGLGVAEGRWVVLVHFFVMDYDGEMLLVYMYLSVEPVDFVFNEGHKFYDEFDSFVSERTMNFKGEGEKWVEMDDFGDEMVKQSSMEVSESHFLLLIENKVKVGDTISQHIFEELYFDQKLDSISRGVLGVWSDAISGLSYEYYQIFRVSMNDEGRDVWKVYLVSKEYVVALADCHEALRTFLLLKLDTFAKVDKFQITIILSNTLRITRHVDDDVFDHHIFCQDSEIRIVGHILISGLVASCSVEKTDNLIFASTNICVIGADKTCKSEGESGIVVVIHEDMVQKYKDVGASMVICQWGFDDEANHLMMHGNLPTILWIGGVELELIAITKGVRIILRFHGLTPEELGNARLVQKKAFRTSKDRVIYIQQFVEVIQCLIYELYISRGGTTLLGGSIVMDSVLKDEDEG